MPLVQHEDEDGITAVVTRFEPSNHSAARRAPAGLVGRHVLFYDGVCRYCNRLTRTAAAHDRHDRWRFATLQGSFAADELGRLGVDAAELKQVYVLADYGTGRQRLLGGPDAGVFLWSSLSGWPKLLGVLLSVTPAGLRSWFYRFVAERRYRWFGRYETCPMPSPQTARRYLD
jgi:predicted DCC family thiol-disulfide oxidoreductase YuxK